MMSKHVAKQLSQPRAKTVDESFVEQLAAATGPGSFSA